MQIIAAARPPLVASFSAPQGPLSDMQSVPMCCTSRRVDRKKKNSVVAGNGRIGRPSVRMAALFSIIRFGVSGAEPLQTNQ